MDATPLAQFDGNLIDGLEFCSMVYAVYESIRNTADGPSRMRRRSTHVEKRLLDELLPICKYIQESYRPGRYLSVRWTDGNQQCDAELFQRGEYVNQDYYPAKAFLEVTCTMHKNEHLSRELLDTTGGAFGLEGIRRLKDRSIESVPVSYKNREFIDSYANLLRGRIAAKAKVPCPANTILVVQCTLNMPYMPDEWAELVALVQPCIAASPFREIYLYDTIGQYSVSLHPQSDRGHR